MGDCFDTNDFSQTVFSTNEKFYVSRASLLQYQLYCGPGSFLMIWKENSGLEPQKDLPWRKLTEHFQTAPFPEPIYTELVDVATEKAERKLHQYGK